MPDFIAPPASSTAEPANDFRHLGLSSAWRSLEPANTPLEIDLSSYRGNIDGAVVLPGSETQVSLAVALFRTIGEELLFDRLAYPSTAVGNLGRFTMQGIAPGDDVLLAWPADAQIAYAEPESIRRYKGRGKTIRVDENAKVSVVLDKVLMPK